MELVLNSVTESIVRLKVLKFSAAAFIALTVSWLLIRTTLTLASFGLLPDVCVGLLVSIILPAFEPFVTLGLSKWTSSCPFA